MSTELPQPEPDARVAKVKASAQARRDRRNARRLREWQQAHAASDYDHSNCHPLYCKENARERT